ncbi:hypothetical protein JCM14036_33820 [Desulfotomaculum defluvii]
MQGCKGISHSKGFTIIEVLVAMFILMMVLLPLSTTLSLTNRGNMENELHLKALHLAKAKLEEIKALNWLEFKCIYLDDPSYLNQEEPGQFGAEYGLSPNQFTYRSQVLPGESNLSYTLQVTVYYKEAGKERWETLYTEKLRR